MFKRSLLFPISLFLPAIVLTSCQSKPELQVRADTKGTPVTVKTVTVTESELPTYYDAVGTVRARNAAQISARIVGTVREVRVNTGDQVRPEQVLIILDARDLEVRRRQAEAALVESQGTEAEAQNAIESAKANLELAEITFRRMKDLHDKTSISNQEFDEASARLRVAKANLEMVQSRRKQVAAKMEQAREETNAARIQNEYATITAPFAGLVTEKSIEPGNVVTPGRPLLTIERGGAYRLEVNVEEGKIAKVRRGSRVAVSLESLDRTVAGTVSEVVPAVDPSSRAFIAKIDLPALPLVRSGLFGRARFELGTGKVLTVPVNAAVERGQMQWVFLADGDTARGRIVTLGKRHENRWEVLSGLKAGERIVAPAPPDLMDGAKLEVRQ